MARGSIVEEGFRGTVACKLAGISYRQLDYWARKGIVVPSVRDAGGSGTQRLYSFGDIAQLRMIKKLLDAGVTLPKIRRALDYVHRDLKRPLQDVTLVSDGKTIFACTSDNEIVDAVKGGQAVFAVAVDAVYQELQGTIAHLKLPAGTDGAAEGAHGG